MYRVVLDTNVLVSAIRSGKGASAEVLRRLSEGEFEIAISVPVVFEYEDALLRHVRSSPFNRREIASLIDALCAIAVRTEVFFLWRPTLKDPKDDIFLELAVAAQCSAIITHNTSDFSETPRFHVEVLTPFQFLTRLREHS